jgi:hypothetical protein
MIQCCPTRSHALRILRTLSIFSTCSSFPHTLLHRHVLVFSVTCSPLSPHALLILHMIVSLSHRSQQCAGSLHATPAAPCGAASSNSSVRRCIVQQPCEAVFCTHLIPSLHVVSHDCVMVSTVLSTGRSSLCVPHITVSSSISAA